MPIELPSLDDRTWADLVKEGVALIPRYAPEWTNHNPSDPGITLVELFAHIVEIYLYRVDRVSGDARGKFLQLLGGTLDAGQITADFEQVQRHVAGLRRSVRAVSPADFEALAREALREHGQHQAVARVHCLPRRNLESRTAADRRRDRANHVSVVFVPHDLDALAEATERTARIIREHIEPRRLLTTRVHVVPARFVDVTLRVRARVRRAASAASATRAMRAALDAFVAPQEDGWTLGRSFYLADLYRLLSRVSGVSQIDGIAVEPVGGGEPVTSEDGEIVGVRLDPDEWLRVRQVDIDARP